MQTGSGGHLSRRAAARRTVTQGKSLILGAALVGSLPAGTLPAPAQTMAEVHAAPTAAHTTSVRPMASRPSPQFSAAPQLKGDPSHPATGESAADQTNDPSPIHPELAPAPALNPDRDPNLAPGATVDPNLVTHPDPPTVPGDSRAPNPTNPDNIGEPTTSAPTALLPVGLGANGRVTVTSVLVRGEDDGTGAVNFDRWLLPVDAVLRALDLTVTPQANGQWELRSAGLVRRLDPATLQQDPALGQVISIAEIQAWLDVPATFDVREYAVMFAPPWAGVSARGAQAGPAPIVTAGLPQVAPPPFTLTFGGHDLRFSGGEGQTTTAQGNLTALGTLWGGSWFLRMNQGTLGDPTTWSFTEAQYLIETAATDYALGTQPTFWQSQGSGTYWGVTTIQRFNYDPQIPVGAGGFNPSTRLQSDVVGRDIVGEAAPGSVVQLVAGTRTNVIAEVFVDSSGVYRFEGVPQGGLYEVLVYPNGQLTAQPEVQDVSFSTLPTQLPAGASAFVASAGLRQNTAEGDLMGSFDDLTGGLSYRRGLTDELTVGAGIIYDVGILGLGELFYQPSGAPIQLAMSVLGGETGLEFDADFAYTPPDSDFRLDLSTDELSSRFRANWQMNSGLGLRATGDTRDGALGLGFTQSFSGPDLSGFASVDVLTNGDLRWNGLARSGSVEFSTIGNEISTNSDLLVKLTPEPSFSEGHFLRVGFATQVTEGTNSLFSLGYRYQSLGRAQDGRFQWAIDAGYGVGSQGSGPILALSTAIVPGLVLQARYEAVSTVSGDSTFSIELLPFYNFQAGVATDDARFEDFRQQGGLWVQPFADANGNGRYDPREWLLLDHVHLLLRLNQQSIEPFRPVVYDDGILLTTVPGLYRLDLDPAGYPLDWTPTQTSYAVEVVPGGFTPIQVPFLVSYTVAGVVTDAQGDPVGQATVEAVPEDGGLPVTTVTSAGGVYFLEELGLGNYSLRVNQQPVQPGQITLDGSSETFQELNLQLGPGQGLSGN